jgi:transcriptional regulator
MYTPSAFRVEDTERLQSFMREYSFATLVSASDGVPSATHLPFVIRPEEGRFGTLVGHMARANTLWTTWARETEVLVIFTGPHAYISPSWYEQKVTVPTWNYSAAHAYGKPRLLTDVDQLRLLVRHQTKLYEHQERSTWDQSLMEEILNSQLRAIVGFTIEIERLEGKFKFNQNRGVGDQDGVASTLERSGCPFKRSVGIFMRSVLRGR